MSTQVAVKENQSTKPEVQGRAVRRSVVPEYRLVRNEDKFELIALIPGVPQANLDIQVEGPFLKIQGAMDEPKFDGYKRVHTEFSYVNYESSFRLSDDIDRDGIKAELEHGLLKVTLPKVAEVLPKKIPVAVHS